MPETPEPCRCRVERANTIVNEDLIIYCPTHASAQALLAAGSRVVSLWEAMSQTRPERPWGFANDDLDAAEVERMVELLDELSAAIAQAKGDAE